MFLTALRTGGVALALLLLWPDRPRAGPEPPWVARVEGIVFDATSGQPIAEAHVTLPALGLSARTGPQGDFALARAPLPSPAYATAIVVTAPGYGEWRLIDARLFAGDALRLRVALSPEPTAIRAPLPRALAGRPSHQVASGAGPPRLVAASDLSFPQTIRVGITGQVTCTTPPPVQEVVIVDFRDYVKHVLPNEWYASWHAEALRAGAMAVKTYAWYWVEQGGKWPAYGADVVDSACDQVYIPYSSHSRTDQAVDDTWGHRMLREGGVFPAYYYAGEYNGDPIDGHHMTQWGSKYWADQGEAWDWIVGFYYDGVLVLAPRVFLPLALRPP